MELKWNHDELIPAIDEAVERYKKAPVEDVDFTELRRALRLHHAGNELTEVIEGAQTVEDGYG